MALRRCRECTTTFAVGLPACPHCSSTDHEEDGAMPKITRHGGPTIAGATVVGGSWGNEGDPDVWPEPEQAAEESADEGSEEPSASSSSETSPEKPSSESEKSEAETPKRARKTASRSTKGRTGSSSARSTGGGRTEAGSETDSAADDGASS
jgi:hypothetical protein